MKLIKKIIAIVSVIILFICCDRKQKLKQNFTDNANVTIFEADGCEYIELMSIGQETQITHRGQCKFCKQRAIDIINVAINN